MKSKGNIEMTFSCLSSMEMNEIHTNGYPNSFHKFEDAGINDNSVALSAIDHTKELHVLFQFFDTDTKEFVGAGRIHWPAEVVCGYRCKVMLQKIDKIETIEENLQPCIEPTRSKIDGHK